MADYDGEKGECLVAVDMEPKCNPFGTRYLTDETRVFEHNAWDNVEWNDDMKQEALNVIERQKTMAVSKEKVTELLENPANQWDAFYSQHTDNFFKDRNWLLKEFHELDMEYHTGPTPVRVLEVGCGVGNTTFPLIQWDQHKRMFLYTSDYSSVAVDVLKSNEKYDESRMKAFQWDITQPAPSDAPEAGTIDYVVCIYVLSAIHPSLAKKTIEHLVSMLKPGGMLLVKDYGRYDLTQLRFKKDRLMEENLYCRGDGTLVYFFDQDQLDQLLVESGLVKKMNTVDKRLIVNRAKQNKKALLKLSLETMKFKDVFDLVLKEPEVRSIISDPMVKGNIYLLYVLLHEFLAGPGLNRASPKLKAVVMKKGKELKDIEKILASDKKGVAAVRERENEKEKPVQIPRYARINTLKWSKEEALKTLTDENWKVIELEGKELFADRVAKLQDDQVLIDPHVENLLVFPIVPDFHTYWMVEQRYLILQDKASCLPAFLLNPPPGSQVFDTCAAPGMKTSHAAAIMNNKGKVWAMDRAEDRVATMQTLLDASGVTCANVSSGDFLKTDVTSKQFGQVAFAIVDPPCSGSGIVKRMDEVTGGNADKSRLAKLKNLQAMILKHAMKLPALKRVVYSTCSIHEEENEQVVDEVLLDTNVRQHFRLSDGVLPSWTHRGISSYEDIGDKCLRADPKATLTNGFFVAVFERLEENDE